MEIEKEFLKTKIGTINPLLYCSEATPRVVRALKHSSQMFGESDIASGITIASPGFFGSEGRMVGRIKPALSSQEFLVAVQGFRAGERKIVNLEMETGILFRIAHEILGYNVGAVCLVVDNLATNKVLEKREVGERMDRCVCVALDAMVELQEK